ncbi:autotransporter outer membrane beta-barrel domain-containing protein [Pseudomonas sp. NPDC090202]|uniref:autotransporter outer membrane beta-barrel domain-containing protein n=1 Tax=unclassified Pseudomonas TaxID=196821 RepID=UPI0037FF1423
MSQCARFCHRREWVAVAMIMTLSECAWGAVVPPGGSAVVNPGDVPETWQLTGATLTVNPGGQTLGISTFAGSTVTLNSAAVSETTNDAVSVLSSTATISGSTLTSSSGTGLSAARDTSSALAGSTVAVTGSTISGLSRGVSVSAGSTVTLSNSQVTGTGTGVGDGLGISLIGGEAIVQGSQVTGSTRGIGLFSSATTGQAPHLLLDASTLTSGAGSAILVSNQGGPAMTATIEVNNGSSLSAANGTLLEVGDATSPAGSTNAVFTVNASTLTGNVQVLPGATADVSLLGSSALTGNLSNVTNLSLDNSRLTGDVTSDASPGTAITLNNGARLAGTVSNGQSMAVGSGSTFDMVNDSSVGALTLNGGTVNLRGGNGAFRTLTASSLAGAGTFAIGTDLAGHLSDLVNITGQASGNHVLWVQNSGAEPVEENHSQLVVHTGGGDAAFAVESGQVSLGTFNYDLQQQGTDWFLSQAIGGDGGPIISPGAQAVIGVFSAAPTVWYGELSTLRSRMGELRNGHEQGGFWARTYGNKYNVSAADQVNYSQTQQGVSFGVDTPIASRYGQWLVGVMGGYSNSALNLREGANGRVNSYYLGAYSTWLLNDGYYVDALFKVNRFQNRADVRLDDGSKAKGDYDNYGVGGSVEAGRRFDLADGWFVEPFVQGSALWVNGENYDLNNGLQARSNKADSFLGKIGTHAGRTIALQSGGFIQPYVKVALAHEFASSNEVKVNSTTFNDDLSGSRGELGAGVVAQINQALQLHADVDYSNGRNIEQPWGVNLGLRYAW